MGRRTLSFWGISSADLFQQIQLIPQGLTGNKAKAHINRFGYNRLKPKSVLVPLPYFLLSLKAQSFLYLSLRLSYP